MTGQQAEDCNQYASHEGERHIKHKIGLMSIDPLPHFWPLGQEDEMKQINVERTGTDVLQATPEECLPSEYLLIVKEEHDHSKEK